MKKIGIVSLVLGFLALGLLPRTASAQANVSFGTTFDFMVQDTKMPAGTYQIAKVNESTYRLTNVKSHEQAMFTIESTLMQAAPKSFTLYFNVYGDQYYLSKFCHRGETSGFMIPQTDAEKALAQKGPAKIKTVIGKTP